MMALFVDIYLCRVYVGSVWLVHVSFRLSRQCFLCAHSRADMLILCVCWGGDCMRVCVCACARACYNCIYQN